MVVDMWSSSWLSVKEGSVCLPLLPSGLCSVDWGVSRVLGDLLLVQQLEKRAGPVGMGGGASFLMSQCSSLHCCTKYIRAAAISPSFFCFSFVSFRFCEQLHRPPRHWFIFHLSSCYPTTHVGQIFTVLSQPKCQRCLLNSNFVEDNASVVIRKNSSIDRRLEGIWGRRGIRRSYIHFNLKLFCFNNISYALA